MEITMKVKKVFNIEYLQVEAGVRYWEDSTINGTEDTENGTLIPCKEGSNWCPLIELETGKIVNWEQGKTANIHYKVCDDGSYFLLDENRNTVKKIDGYVPKIMCPKENGYGDYIIMDIEENGFIQNWKINLNEFKVK